MKPRKDKRFNAAGDDGHHTPRPMLRVDRQSVYSSWFLANQSLPAAQPIAAGIGP